MTQLPLPLPVEPPLRFIAMCHLCDRPVAVVPVEGPNWNAAEAWCYLAQKDHERTVHGLGVGVDGADPGGAAHPRSC